MPAFADTLTADEISEVARYVAEVLAADTARNATVAEGGRWYRVYCAGCHGATGRGGALAGGDAAPSFAGMPAANALAAMAAGPGPMPVFADTTFDPRRQAAVARYVAVLADPESPGGFGLLFRGPITEGALAIVLGLGGLVGTAVWVEWGQEDREA